MWCKLRFFILLFINIVCVMLLLSGCERKLGWGVLLWANEEAGIPSGAILPVYIKSNIEKKWIAGIPREYRTANFTENKIAIPLPQLELAGSKGAAKKVAGEFSAYALIYAETLQDGLPVRSDPDNSASRVYRLRMGEVIKILSPEKGAPAISTTGEPLPGEWYRVLTEDGTRGYCFSYRLRLFDHTTGPLNFAQQQNEPEDDRLLQTVQTKIWSSQVYDDMLSSRKFDLDALTKHWRFSTGEDTGIANIYTTDIDRSFQYAAIRSIGDRSWRFDGTSLTMTLLSDTFLKVQFIDHDGMNRSANFVALPVRIDDLIVQEQARRDALFAELFAAGPEFTSEMFGKLILTEDADFFWEGFDPLIPDYIPVSALGRGKVEIRWNLSDELAEYYTGVVSFRFKTIGSTDRDVSFLYKIGSETGASGVVSFEYLSPEHIKDALVTGKDETPFIIYFFKVP